MVYEVEYYDDQNQLWKFSNNWSNIVDAINDMATFIFSGIKAKIVEIK